MAAVGFGFKWIWLARAALVLPFLVSCVQLKNPGVQRSSLAPFGKHVLERSYGLSRLGPADCPEALALRLFKAGPAL